MSRDIPINDSFPHGLHEALARLVIEFGRLEYLIKLCFKDLSEQGFDEGLLAAETIDGFQRLCNSARDAALEKLTDVEHSAFDRILRNASELAIYRNDSVHAYWTMENDVLMRIRIRQDGDALDWTRSRNVSVSEISGKADDIRQLHEELQSRRMQWTIRANVN